MAIDLGNIDEEDNDLLDLAVDLGSLKGTYIAAGQIESLAVDVSSDAIDFYRFDLDTVAPLNSYIELSSVDVVNSKLLIKCSCTAMMPSMIPIRKSSKANNYPITPSAIA